MKHSISFHITTEPNDSIEQLVVHRHPNEPTCMVIKRLNIKILVHLIDDVLDPPFHLAFTVGNPTAPVPPFENPKDQLNRVQFRGVRRQEDVVDVVVMEEGCCCAGMMDPGVVHHKADFSIPDGWEVVSKRLKVLHEVGCFERPLLMW